MTHSLDRPVVVVNQLSRTFDQQPALSSVNMQAYPGQVYGIVGENGAGKTTLIKHLLGLYKAQSGTVRVFDKNPVKQPEAVLSNIGYLSEQPDMPAWMKISELINYTAAFYPGWDSSYTAELVAMFGLDTSLQVRNLSKGMRAQLGLVLAQAHRPRLLLLDEPSSGLDPNVRRDILSAIIRTVVDEGRTVIFSSHLLEEVERVSDHLMMLRKGQIMLSDPMEQVLSDHHRLTFKSSSPPPFLGQLDQVLRSEALGDEWQVDCYGPLEALRAHTQSAGIELLSHHRLSLNEIFLLRSRSLSQAAPSHA